MKFFESFFEVIGWCKIAISPILIGGIIGAIIYFNMPNTYGIVLAIIPALAGIVIGAIWATKIWKTKEGTMHYISRVDATPDLDKKEEEK
jgi:hypothetical protein